MGGRREGGFGLATHQSCAHRPPAVAWPRAGRTSTFLKGPPEGGHLSIYMTPHEATGLKHFSGPTWRGLPPVF